MTPTSAAYLHGEKTALLAFGLTKEAFAPLIGAGLMAAGRAALPMLARGAAKVLPMLARGAKSVGSQLPGMAAQTGMGMAAEKLMQPHSPGPATAPMPGMVGQGNLPGMVA